MQPIAYIADDDDDFRLLLANALYRAGFVVKEASDGQSLVAQIQNDNPTRAVVVSDIDMPILDGVSAAERLRRLPNKIPIILVTSNWALSVSLGRDLAEEVVFKPVDYGAVARLSKELVEKSGDPIAEGAQCQKVN